jgi:hypothetical protein
LPIIDREARAREVGEPLFEENGGSIESAPQKKSSELNLFYIDP